MTAPKWQGSLADVYSHRYGRVAQDFLRYVVEPSLDALRLQRHELNCIDEPTAVFARLDLMELINKTNMAFCLSIQSLWEQQIRRYLTDCIRHLELEESIEKIEKASWGDDLERLFYRIRGVQLSSFDSYATFNLLQMLANACRHGDGSSARKLWKEHSELWPKQEFYPFIDPTTISPPSIQFVLITHELLTEFVNAIEWFWDDIKYEYNSSISNGNLYIEAGLAEIRITRSQRAKRAPIGPSCPP